MNVQLAQLTALQRDLLRERLRARVLSVEPGSGDIFLIEAALDRLVEGVYGLCIECGAPLPWRRLESRPEAARCVRCESEQDRRRAGPAHPSP